MQRLLVNASLALRNILRQKRRSAIALGAIAFGIASLILATGFIERMFLDFREDTIRSQLGHLQIVRPGYHLAGKADPYSYLLPAAVPAFEDATGAGHIQTVAPRLSFSGLISHGDATLSFMGDGVSPEQEAAFGAVQISAGSHLSQDEPLAITVGEGLARNLGVNVGDRVVLLATTKSGGTNAVEVNVRGLFSTVAKAYDDAAIRVPLGTAQKLLRAEGAHVWTVMLHDTAQTGRVARTLRASLPEDQFEIVPWHLLSDFYNKTQALFAKQMQGLRVVIALIILLSISNTMMMSVMQRIGEIGTSMALGMKRRGVVGLFLSEGFMLGCLGGFAGVIVGVVLAQIVSSIGIPMPPPPGKTHGYTGGILVTLPIAIEALALAIATTLLASVYPAWRASRMQIVDALRHNR